jgi:hypothetical protein
MAIEQATLLDDLISRLNRRPFVPFVVQLTDGERHIISRIAQMAVGLNTAIIADPAGTKSRHVKVAEIGWVKDV